MQPLTGFTHEQCQAPSLPVLLIEPIRLAICCSAAVKLIFSYLYATMVLTYGMYGIRTAFRGHMWLHYRIASSKAESGL